MFARNSKKVSKTPATRRPQLEQLEGRDLMATTYLVLDFTPDYRYGSLKDTFRYSQYSDGTFPPFLDMDGDRAVSDRDVSIAASYIRDAVAQKFAAAANGYDVRVVFNDVHDNTNFGARYIKYGIDAGESQQVAVMYIGGRNQGEYGRAPLARAGYNVEGFGQTYSQTIASNLMQRRGVSNTYFLQSVAETAAHELGHMLGLQHSRNAFWNDIMNPQASNTPSQTVFSAVDQRVENGTVQNAVASLRASFAGQPEYYQYYNGGARMGAHDHDHDHAHVDPAHMKTLPMPKLTGTLDGTKVLRAESGKGDVFGLVRMPKAAAQSAAKNAAVTTKSAVAFAPDAVFNQIGAAKSAKASVVVESTITPVTAKQVAPATPSKTAVVVATPAAKNDAALLDLFGNDETEE